MSDLDQKIRLFGVANDSIVDGPGLRYAVYTQGCSHKCKGCQNPESWPFEGGTVTTVGALIDDIAQKELIHDVTLSGGDPFCQAGPVCALARELKKRDYGIWAYSGYTFEQLQELSETDEDIKELLNLIDVLVDGRFVEDLKSLDLKWKGSSNQRVIDMKKTRNAGKIVIYQTFVFDDKIPENW